MAQTLTCLLIHIIFSTKDRIDLIDPSIEPDLYAYIGGIARREECVLIAANGTANHVHLLVSLSKNIAVSRLLMHLKKDSSRWINDRDPGKAAFGWQDGYAAFSVAASQVDSVKTYIAKQKEHHRQISYQDELRNVLKKYGVAYDEKYVWT